MKEEDLPDWTNNERPPFVPKTVTQSEDNIYAVTDNNPRKSFDELYNEYSAMSITEQINNLKELSRDFVTKVDKIIDQLDDIIEGDPSA
jgi:hypothetical protein